MSIAESIMACSTILGYVYTAISTFPCKKILVEIFRISNSLIVPIIQKTLQKKRLSIDFLKKSNENIKGMFM